MIVYDATILAGKPKPTAARETVYDRSKHGLVPGTRPMVSESRVWRASAENVLSWSESNWNAWISNIPRGSYVMLDLEARVGQMNPYYHPATYADAYQDEPMWPVLEAARAARPDLKWGAYGWMPWGLWYGWYLTDATSLSVLAEFDTNNQVPFTKIDACAGSAVDLFDFVIVDTYYQGPSSDPIPRQAEYIVKAIEGNVSWARRYQKPVFGITWHKYNADQSRELPAEVYRATARTIRDNCDAAILWSAPGEAWAASSRWYPIAQQIYDLEEDRCN